MANQRTSTRPKPARPRGKRTRHPKATQRLLSFGRGGWRPGAGRKPSRNKRRRVPHRARPSLSHRHPVHVVLRVRREVRSLRTKKRYQVLRNAFVAVSKPELTKDFRVTDWSLQGDHIHLVVEATDQPSLSRGMKGLNVRLARAINRSLGRRGPVFAERFWSRPLLTPQEVRNTRAYVLLNMRRHLGEVSSFAVSKWVDPYSSWAWFNGWADLPKEWLDRARAGPEAVRPVAKPKSWLLREGWKRHGLIRLTENPGRVRPPARPNAARE